MTPAVEATNAEILAAPSLLEGLAWTVDSSWRDPGGGKKKRWVSDTKGQRARYQIIQPLTRAPAKPKAKKPRAKAAASTGGTKGKAAKSPGMAGTPAPASTPPPAAGAKAAPQQAPKQQAPQPQAAPAASPPKAQMQAIAAQAEKHLSDPAHPMNAKRAQLADATFAGNTIKTVRSTKDSPLSSQEHAAMAGSHFHVAKILKLNGNAPLAASHEAAAQHHVAAAKAKAGGAKPAAPPPVTQAPAKPITPPASQAKPPTPQVQAKPATPPAPSATHQEFVKKHGANIDKNPNIPPEQRQRYKDALHKAIQHMPEAALSKINDKDFGGIHFAASVNDWQTPLVAHYTEADQAGAKNLVEWGMMKAMPTMEESAANARQLAAETNPGTGCKGFYLSSGGKASLFLDGEHETFDDISGKRRVQTHETYAHEITHVLDGPTQALSNDAAWQQAFKDEIDQDVDAGTKGTGEESRGGRLDGYARTNAMEGFAEFGRLLYGTDMDLGHIERHFPQSAAFFKSKGLWPNR
jgi:hypothetical protein